MSQLSNGKGVSIAIIDYDLSNMFSVQLACRHLGYETEITTDANTIRKADAVILPGVGAFGAAMEKLQQLHMIEAIAEVIKAGKPFMGVCLGMQLLFEESEEFGQQKGLGYLRGSIKRFPDREKTVAIPQISWNQINAIETGGQWKDSPFSGLHQGEFMYFVHSYYAKAAEEKDVLSTTDYAGIQYCSSVKKDNIFATQFHPEKSAEKGLLIYQNWLSAI